MVSPPRRVLVVSLLGGGGAGCGQVSPLGLDTRKDWATWDCVEVLLSPYRL